MTEQRWRLVVHGGAGVIEPDRITPQKDREIRQALDHALATGAALLEVGGRALDAVEVAVRELEDNPNFNAGRGAVFTHDGKHELDAAIMDGRERAAGAISGVTATKNPISLARAVMERSVHVFLSGAGADQFARDEAIDQVGPEWFATAERRRQLDEINLRKASQFDIDVKYGTVGAVAVDAAGNVAAATSTGGLTGKRWGRIGDSPLIGAGTYADNRSVAVSATGAGEFFIRAVAAHEVAARVRIGGQSLQQALEAVLADIGALGGSGGMIAVTPRGEAAWAFTTPGMYRAMASNDGRRVALYSEVEER
jgi:L-asparaginase / beta-aspartyl-peptidase